MIEYLANSFLVGVFAGRFFGINIVYIGIVWYIAKSTWNLYNISKVKFAINLAILTISAGYGASISLEILKFLNPRTQAAIVELGSKALYLISGVLLIFLLGIFYLYACYKFIQLEYSESRLFFAGFWLLLAVPILGVLYGLWKELLSSAFFIFVASVITAAIFGLCIRVHSIISGFYLNLAKELSQQRSACQPSKT